jgi:hypothetical protein
MLVKRLPSSVKKIKVLISCWKNTNRKSVILKKSYAHFYVDKPVETVDKKASLWKKGFLSTPLKSC